MGPICMKESWPRDILCCGQLCRRRGCRACKRTHKSFDLLKMQTKSLKIWAKSVKIWAKFMKMFAKYLKFWGNYVKSRKKLAPNVVWIWKIDAQRRENHMKTFFSEVIPKMMNYMNYSHKKLPESFSGKFGEILFSTPKNLAAPTPVCGYGIFVKKQALFDNCKLPPSYKVGYLSDHSGSPQLSKDYMNLATDNLDKSRIFCLLLRIDNIGFSFVMIMESSKFILQSNCRKSF